MVDRDIVGALTEVFGFQTFRPNQEEIVRSILTKRDVFAVMPTGGGKSLCYQLPATVSEGTAVVISPLISLMKDQVDAACQNGIPAAFMNSSMTSAEMSDVYRSLRQRAIKLLYIAPERFSTPNFLETLKNLSISFFAIDEAHCISEWGHDFRPDYLGLSLIRKEFPGVPVAAFTATATEKVQNDIIRKICLREPLIVRASFNRPNLFYEVKEKEKARSQIIEFIKARPGESGIVYRATRDAVMETSEHLASQGIRALPYHAGLTAEQRNENQEAFSRDEAQVVVATIAFGMGIDKSNVRYVLHADLPKNLESYYQETGRAGRDGEPAYCLLLFSRGDIPKIRHFIDKTEDEQERYLLFRKLNMVVEYASHNVCRRKQLLGFFGENYARDNCSTCDICTGSLEQVDITIDAQIIMSAISRTSQRFGGGQIIDIVTGSDTKRVRELRHHEIKTFGAGKDKPKTHWRFLINELLAQEMLAQEGDPYPVLKLTQKGTDVLYGKAKASALKKRQAARTTKERDDSGTYDEGLFENLRALRKKLARENAVPPYVIFSDNTLREMCRRLPASLPELRQITGVGDTKLERYGDEFVRAIGAFLRK